MPATTLICSSMGKGLANLWGTAFMNGYRRLAQQNDAVALGCKQGGKLTSSIVHGSAASIIRDLHFSTSLEKQLGALQIASIAGSHQGGPRVHS